MAKNRAVCRRNFIPLGHTGIPLDIRANLTPPALTRACLSGSWTPPCNIREALPQGEEWTMGIRMLPWLLLADPASHRATVSRGGARAPSAQQRPQALGAAGNSEEVKVSANSLQGWWALPSNCGVRLPAAQVSTTRMRGMGLGLGGLDILTLPRFSVLARVWVLKLP